MCVTSLPIGKFSLICTFFCYLCHNGSAIRKKVKGAIHYMQQSKREVLFNDAHLWVKEAGDIIKQSFITELNIQYKTNFSDLVTNVDKQVEQFFINKIHTKYVGHRVLGEEGFGDKEITTEGVIWIIDPIDGTTNFVNQQRHFAISLAIYEDGIGQIGIIYDVMSDEMYHCRSGEGAYLNDRPLSKLEKKPLSQSLIGINASWLIKNRKIDPSVLTPLVNEVRGIRSYGSAAIEIAYVASGRLDGYISLRLSPWDFAAGKLLIDEVGGVLTKIDGEEIELLKQNTIFAANPSVHEEILDTFILPKLK